jgi:hypothetical protein
LAVLDAEDNLCYSTPVTDDVIGHLSEEDVQSKLREIMALPKAGKATKKLVHR